ncbi:MAG: hypothetical protein HY908_21560 [Myxococcales bacterium]|nr:hypothetical protein [Myxococcales bacterium]
MSDRVARWAQELLLEELADATPGEVEPALGAAGSALLVAECLAVGHPTLGGRALCRVTGPRGEHLERWLPTLHTLACRPGDRLLVARPDNWAEPVVVGVVDGYARRPEYPQAPGPRVVLERDAALQITDADGKPVVEIRDAGEGPVVRLLGRGVDLEIDGKLRLAASAIELSAREGDVRIAASADVVVAAETIHLN